MRQGMCAWFFVFVICVGGGSAAAGTSSGVRRVQDKVRAIWHPWSALASELEGHLERLRASTPLAPAEVFGVIVSGLTQGDPGRLYDRLPSVFG